MNLFAILIVGLLSIILCAVIARLYSAKVALISSAAAFVLGLLLILLLGNFQFQSELDTKTEQEPQFDSDQLAQFRPIATPADGYVTSKDCSECHPHPHETWTASYHRTMTQVVSSESVLGDFDNVTYTDAETQRHFHLYTENDHYWVRMQDPEAQYVDAANSIVRPLVMSTGSHHMQIYWYPTGFTRVLGQLPIVYLNEEQRWVPRNSAFITPPDEPRFFSEAGRWNAACIDCHTTHGRHRPQFDGGMDTRVVEFGIACEACHGPAEKHVKISLGETIATRDIPTPIAQSIVNPARLPHDRSAQVCGRCHVMSMPLSIQDGDQLLKRGFRYRPGDDLSESRFIVRRNQESIAHIRDFTDRYNTDELMDDYLDQSFWSDGEIRIAGREYNGLIESACSVRGEMSCLSCHVMHKPETDSRPLKSWADDQLRVEMQGDRACLQCHDAERFQTPEHTHHIADSSGSRCYNCHMPHTTYGLLKAIRSHTISSPDVAVTVNTGRPNACNLCHLDKTLEWSADHLSDWYGMERPLLDDDQREISSAVLWLLRGDAGQRALLAWSLGWRPAQEVAGTDWMPPFLAPLLEDPYDAVRFIAHRSLKSLPTQRELPYDFIGTPEHRAAVSKEVLQSWLNDPTERSPNSALLIDADGAFQLDRFERLKSQRDDRPVLLSE